MLNITADRHRVIHPPLFKSNFQLTLSPSEILCLYVSLTHSLYVFFLLLSTKLSQVVIAAIFRCHAMRLHVDIEMLTTK
jgi:hypothetical protein